MKKFWTLAEAHEQHRLGIIEEDEIIEVGDEKWRATKRPWFFGFVREEKL